MKKVFIILLFVTNLSFSQTIVEIDSVSVEMCEFLKNMEVKNDTLKINLLYEEQLYPYLQQINQSKIEKVGQQVYYRLQRNCVEFRELLDKLDPPKEAPVRLTEKPKSEISQNELKSFKERENFYYFEVSGDTTRVSMKKGIWKDLFTDETFSKLTYNWSSNKEFELVFVESNNETRSNFSVKGDKYVYQVLSKEDGFYVVSVNIPGQEIYEKIKLYYE